MKRISTRFSIAVHILSLVSLGAPGCTSEYIAGSVNTNPVVVRRIMGLLKKAGLVDVRPGVGGAAMRRSPDEITLLDVYHAVESGGGGALFDFHDEPNPACPVGRGIEAALREEMEAAQRAMEARLAQTTVRDVTAKFAATPTE